MLIDDCSILSNITHKEFSWFLYLDILDFISLRYTVCISSYFTIFTISYNSRLLSRNRPSAQVTPSRSVTGFIRYYFSIVNTFLQLFLKKFTIFNNYLILHKFKL